METTSLWPLRRPIWSRSGCAFLYLAALGLGITWPLVFETSMRSTGDPLNATAFRTYLPSWSLAPLVGEWHYWIPTASGQ